MILIHTIQELRKALINKKGNVGFVPTMGALHSGHASLIARAKKENKVCVASIFVNPTQFNNSSDLEKYPRTLEKDCEILEQEGCDIAFAPSVDEMYPSLPNLSFNFGAIEKVMEGEHRIGHFNGVGIVVSKLFHIVQPERAYFGLKDLQQVAIIKQLVNDLSFQIEIVPCDTIREPNGLAMSSRNTRLSKEGREKAGIIQESLQYAKKLVRQGADIPIVKIEIEKFYARYPDFKVEYFEISDFETLKPLHFKANELKQTAICTAVFFENVRLIDNVVF